MIKEWYDLPTGFDIVQHSLIRGVTTSMYAMTDTGERTRTVFDRLIHRIQHETLMVAVSALKDRRPWNGIDLRRTV